MRILHLISSNGFYGAENVLLNLAKSLKAKGHTPYLMCINGYSKPEPEIQVQARRHGLRSVIIPCHHGFDIGVFGKIKDFIGQEGIGLVHSHGYKSNLYGLVASRIAKIPIVSTLHGWTGENGKVRIYESLDRWLIRKMDHLVAVSPMICEELAVMKLNGTGATFIPNGIDMERFDPDKVETDVRKEFGLEAALVIGTVGRLSREKGHIYLIEAFKKIHSQIPEARLLIVGDGPLKDNLQFTAYNLQLKDKVIFTGKREDLHVIYKAMDLFVLPSLKEGIPVALLEAMSMELPVVATRVGGIPYVVSADENGILVEPKDIDALAQAITLLIKDPSRRQRLGRRAREKIVSQFSIENFYKRYLEVYKKLLCHSITEVS